jgi:hypothetical protein
MKKISLFTLAMATGWASMAQVTTNPSDAHKPVRTEMSTQPRFGLRGGVSLSSLEIDDDYNATNYSTNSKTTFHAGAFVNIPLGRISVFSQKSVIMVEAVKLEETWFQILYRLQELVITN